MDEAHKILPKHKHKHWDRWKSIHGEKTANYVRSILHDEVDRDVFIEIYMRLSTAKRKKQTAKKEYKYLTKHSWIRAKK